MVCDCCGKKRRLFESFAEVKYRQELLYFCVECNDLAYKVREAANEHNKIVFDNNMNKWNTRANKASKMFFACQQEFLEPLELLLEQKA